MSLFAGLNRGASARAVRLRGCLRGGRGAVLARVEARHGAAGLADPLARPTRIAPPDAPPDAPLAAVERPSGLVETLIAAGHPVAPIRPDAVKACRPRHRAAGGRSDPGDASMLADVLRTDILRTDGHRLGPLAPVSEDVKALRAMVRGRDELVAARVAVADQLRSLPESVRPGAAVLADLDSPVAPALARLPTPESARRLGPSRMRAFMAQHRCCGRRSAEERLARLRAAPQGAAGEAEADAKGEMPRALVRALGPLVGAIRDLSSRVEHATANLPDGRIVTSPDRVRGRLFPRAGRICAARMLARMLAGLGDVRARFQAGAQLAAEAGVRPPPSSLGPTALQRRPHASGKGRGVDFRWARNHRLRPAVTRFADSSRPAPPQAADVHRRARGRATAPDRPVAALRALIMRPRAHSRSPIRNSTALSRRMWGGPSPGFSVSGAGAKRIAA